MEFENCFFETADYEITNKKLGEGSYGKVYVVKCQNDDFLYAAKIINTQGVFSSHDQMMFLRESFILMKFDHPAIVKFYGINFHSFDNPNYLNPTILTEYYANGSLKEILDKEKKQHCRCQLESHEKVYLFTWNYRCNAISAQGRHYSPRSKATKHSC